MKNYYEGFKKYVYENINQIKCYINLNDVYPIDEEGERHVYII